MKSIFLVLTGIIISLSRVTADPFGQETFRIGLDTCARTTNAAITASDVRTRIYILAADSMEGRDTPSRGLDRAARYAANEFSCIGLFPGASDTSYFQYFPIRGGHAPNIIGILPGSDSVLKDEYVVFSAHIDHIGMGSPMYASGDSIYNGADDNASGVSVVLEIAEMIARMPERPKRSILFLLVSGEEKGLLGSEWFVRNPTVPLDKVVADLNVDMVGRNWPDTVVVIGKQQSSLGPLVDSIAQANSALNLTAINDMWPQQRFYERSDHYNFASRGIPVLFFFSGLHVDYHRVSDEAHKINFEKVSRVAQLIGKVGLAVADNADRPK